MSTLRDSIEVLCPYSTVFEFLRTFVLEHRGQLPLSASLKVVGLPTKLLLEHDVNVSFSESGDGAYVRRSADTLGVTWESTGGGAYPHFSGSIHIEPLHSHSRLILEGSYEPPFGAAGQLFDAVVGRRIAEAAAARLLASLRSSLEAQWFAFTVDHAFVQHDANMRAKSPDAPITTSSFQELSGRATFRTDGSYLGCCIILDGIIAEAPIAISGEYPIEHDVACRLIASLVGELNISNPDFRSAQEQLPHVDEAETS
jgi:hypothetical protein